MSAAMSPPNVVPQRTHAFINHSPETYREAIGARAASRGSPRHGQQQSDSRPSHLDSRVSSPLPSISQSGSPTSIATPVLNSKNPAADENTMNGAINGPTMRSRSVPDTRAHRSDTMPAALPSLPSSAGSTASTESSASYPAMGSSSGSENEKRVKEFKDAPRKRRRTSPNELHILETEFARNNKPCKEERERIAATMGMDEKAVQVWFQNKRQSCRRQQSGAGASRTQSLPMIQTNASFQDENAAPVYAPVASQSPPFTSKPAFAVQTPGSAQPAKRAKSLRLAMSADGKAELVERSPLKSLHQNGSYAPPTQIPQLTPMPRLAMRFASMPLSGMETECATSLLFLKSGHWP